MPSARTAHGLAHDRLAGVTVLFGGCNGQACLGDTWLWNATSHQWVQQVLAIAPASRYGLGLTRLSRLSARRLIDTPDARVCETPTPL